VLGDGGMLGFGGVSGLQMLDYGSYNVGDPQCHGYSSEKQSTIPSTRPGSTRTEMLVGMFVP